LKIRKEGLWSSFSAPPLTAEAASLIEKETPALRSHMRGSRNLPKAGGEFWSQPVVQ